MTPIDLCEKLLEKERKRIEKVKQLAITKGRKLQPAGCDDAIKNIDVALVALRVGRHKTQEMTHHVAWMWFKEKSEREKDNRWFVNEIKILKRQRSALRGHITKYKRIFSLLP